MSGEARAQGQPPRPPREMPAAGNEATTQAPSHESHVEPNYHAPEPGNERYPQSEHRHEERPAHTPSAPAASGTPDVGLVQVETGQERSGDK